MMVTTPTDGSIAPETRAYRVLVYARLSDVADVRATVLADERVSITFAGKFVKGRRKIVAGFHHIRDLDHRYAKLIPSNQQSGESIYRLLKQKGAPEVCYIMSDDSAIDQKEMPLRDAIFKVEGTNFGTLVSCIAGKLAYFETEDLSGRYILAK